MDRLWWSSSNAPSAASFGAVGFPWPQHICGEQRWNHLTFDILMILMFSQVYHIVPWCTTYHRQIHRQIHGSSWIHWFQGGLSEVTTFGSLGFLSQSDHVERFLCSETLWKAAKWLTFRVTSWGNWEPPTRYKEEKSVKQFSRNDFTKSQPPWGKCVFAMKLQISAWSHHGNAQNSAEVFLRVSINCGKRKSSYIIRSAIE